MIIDVLFYLKTLCVELQKIPYFRYCIDYKKFVPLYVV